MTSDGGRSCRGRSEIDRQVADVDELPHRGPALQAVVDGLDPRFDFSVGARHASHACKWVAVAIMRQLPASLQSLEPAPAAEVGAEVLQQQAGTGGIASCLAKARDLFAREVARSEEFSEAHYWLGAAKYRLGKVNQAQRHFTRALKSSASSDDRKIYSAKLDWLRTGGRSSN